MSEHSKSPREVAEQETVEQKKERLRPVLERSFEVFQNPNRSLYEGALTVTREVQRETETLQGLVVLDILDDAVELGGIEEDGEIGASAFMNWEEILDAKEQQHN